MSETTLKDQKAIRDFLSSDGELGELIRNFDWTETPLGPLSQWSQSLKTTVNLMLNSKNPIWIGWGPENTFLYNDAYIDVLGIDKHKWALGKPAYVVWEEIWDVCGPLSDKVYHQGLSSNSNDVQLFMKRGDFLEETFFSFSYSPVFDETGKVGGLFCPNFETTAKILNARRSRTLSELAAKSLVEKTINAACASAALTLNKNRDDIPFAIFYLLDETKNTLEIVQRVGLDDRIEAVYPQSISTDDEASKHIHLIDSFTTGKSLVLQISNPDLFPKGTASQPVKHAVVLPITLSGNKPVGLLVAGINPTRRLDEEYNTFFEMVSGQISTAVQNATAMETERKKLEELAEIDRAKTAFFSNISHEFRTPLTLMLGPLEELLQNHSLTGEKKEIVETTHRNALRLLKLVNTLLDFSLMESGRMKAKFALTDIAAYTENLAGSFRSVIEKAGMQLVVNTEKTDKPVYVDRQMWEKIVFNLLSNSFKYTLKGTITVTISQDTNNLIFRVADTGVGIPEKELPNMFTRFHRIQNSTGRSFEGSGIGLSMIKEFVLQHKGEIWVESKEGKGSIFTVTLPFGKKHLPEAQIMEKTSAADEAVSDNFIREADVILQGSTEKNIEVTPEYVTTISETVLIVDDNADMRKHLRSIIDKHYNVITAENGEDALIKLQGRKADLILSDIMMPVMDGIQLLKAIKENPDTAMIPVVLLTARAGEESRIEGYETGADDYLVKPFSAKELVARIRSQIRISKTRDHIRQQLKNLFIQAPMAICILRGENFVVEMANDNILDLWSKPASMMMNKPLVEGLPEAAAQGFDKLLTQVYTTGISHVDEECPFYKFEDGKQVQTFVKFIYQPLREETGEISGIIVLAHDVTAQVAARKKIEESEIKFRSLIHQAPIGIVIFKGKDLVFDIANNAYLKVHGKKREEVIGKKFTEVLPYLADSTVKRNLEQVINTGVTLSFTDRPVEFITDGVKDIRYFNSVYQPMVEDGNVTGVIAVVNEVTGQVVARKLKEKNEEDIRLILETMPHIAFRANPDGNVTYYNNRYYEYTGLSFEEAKDMGWRAVIHPDMLQEVYESWMHAMRTGKEYTYSFLVRRASDRTYRWHLSRTVALRNEAGEIDQWIGTLTDIHEQKVFSQHLEAMVKERTEELYSSNKMLEEKNIELEQTNKELESFNYVASHDLQEPLRKIQTFISMIRDRKMDAEVEKRYMEKIHSSAGRMSQLIQDVLTYSRLSADNQFDDTDLNQVLNNVLMDYELLIADKNAVVEKENLLTIKAIPLQMHQLFSNMISNSLKYSQNRPIIKISCNIVDNHDFEGQKYVQITFSDNGIGFDQQYGDQIFKLFRRLHGKSEYSGTGIGLSICKKIVEQHNGYITAESAPGEGATFKIMLPL